MVHRPPLPEGPFDLTVIGGGIHGTGIARDAVLRGLTVCLLEKEDLAGGGSGRTSKLVQGGIGDLRLGRVGAVRRCLRERAVLLRIAPHLVRPLPCIIPIAPGGGWRPPAIRAGLLIYDLLAAGRGPGPGRLLRPDEVEALAPGIRMEGLAAGGLHWEAVADDARLCLANAVDAAEAGGGRFFLRTRAEVIERRRTSPIALRIRDRILGKDFTIFSHRVVRAAGAWTDDEADGPPLLVPSKATHIVLPSRADILGGPEAADGHAILLPGIPGGRMAHVIPWLGRTLVGTAGTPSSRRPDAVRPEAAEIEELAAGFRRIYPRARLGPEDLLGAFAAVTPLVRGGWFSPGGVSRRHRVVDDRAGTLTVAGGAYTAFRAVAREVVDGLVPGSSSSTSRRPLPGGEGGPWEAFRAAGGREWSERIGEESARSLFGRHGTRMVRILEAAAGDARLAEAIAPGIIRAEVRHAVLHEWVLYPEDFIARRTTLRFSPGQGREAYAAVEEEIRRTLGPAAPGDLDAARERFHEELAAEDRLRKLLAF